MTQKCTILIIKWQKTVILYYKEQASTPAAEHEVLLEFSCTGTVITLEIFRKICAFMLTLCNFSVMEGENLFNVFF